MTDFATQNLVNSGFAALRTSAKESSLRLQGLSRPTKSIPIQEGGCVCREGNNTLRGVSEIPFLPDSGQTECFCKTGQCARTVKRESERCLP